MKLETLQKLKSIMEWDIFEREDKLENWNNPEYFRTPMPDGVKERYRETIAKNKEIMGELDAEIRAKDYQKEYDKIVEGMKQ